MPRPYQRRTNRADADRRIRLRYEPRSEVDVSRIAEVVIRVALHAADEEDVMREAGTHLRDLLRPKQ